MWAGWGRGEWGDVTSTGVCALEKILAQRWWAPAAQAYNTEEATSAIRLHSRLLLVHAGKRTVLQLLTFDFIH